MHVTNGTMTNLQIHKSITSALEVYDGCIRCLIWDIESRLSLITSMCLQTYRPSGSRAETALMFCSASQQ